MRTCRKCAAPMVDGKRCGSRGRSSRPYEPSNVVLCCYFINVSKREKTIEEWLAWADCVAVRRARSAA